MLAAAACSDDAAAPTGTAVGGAAATAAPGETLAPDASIAPQTTFIPDCAGMPAPADLSALVGIPLDVGQVSGAGTCEFFGLNDQSRYVILSKLTDPADQAAFADSEATLGVAVPLNDPALAGAMIGNAAAVYITANGALYSVQTAVTDAAPADQVPLSVAVLKMWLAL